VPAVLDISGTAAELAAQGGDSINLNNPVGIVSHRQSVVGSCDGGQPRTADVVLDVFDVPERISDQSTSEGS
jgi:hypothetical protein